MLKRREVNNQASERPYNNLLRRLNDSDFALIAPHLSQDEGNAHDLLYRPGDDVEIVHFPCGPSLVSYMVPNEDGRDVETILVGREGAVGGIVSQGTCRPIPASRSNSADRSCGSRSANSRRRKPSRPRCAISSRAMPIACWRRFSVDRLQRNPFHRAAHREMDHLGDGTRGRRQHRAADA